MSSNLIHFRPNLIGPCATGNRKPREKSAASSWSTPLFGWSSHTDYIEPDATTKSDNKPETRTDSKPMRSGFAPGCFTEEKARQLRIKTIEIESFHGAMYHSSIANRLASDFKNRSGL